LGEVLHQVWKPDRDYPLAQNVGPATASLRDLAERLGPLLARGDFALVLGGNCTIALGVMAALRRLGTGAPGLLYVDRHYDMNTPDSTTDGALDWMGLAHALALPGCVDTLTDAFGPRPLLEPNQVAWLGVEPQLGTGWEREQAARLGLHVVPSQALADAHHVRGPGADRLDRAFPACPGAVRVQAALFHVRADDPQRRRACAGHPWSPSGRVVVQPSGVVPGGKARARCRGPCPR
jgi:hypothetical protein